MVAWNRQLRGLFDGSAFIAATPRLKEAISCAVKELMFLRTRPGPRAVGLLFGLVFAFALGVGWGQAGAGVGRGKSRPFSISAETSLAMIQTSRPTRNPPSNSRPVKGCNRMSISIDQKKARWEIPL